MQLCFNYYNTFDLNWKEIFERNYKNLDTLIVTGGEINIDFLEDYYMKNNPHLIIAVDKGLEALHKLNIIPHHIVGDLDSINPNLIKVYKNYSEVILHKYNSKKDYTDTDIALNLAIKLKSSTITIIGALGKRIDHTLSNIHILTNALKAKVPCQILDTNNRMYLINSSHIILKKEAYGNYISLIPLTSLVKGLTLTGFQYPLTNFNLRIGKSLGISNEILYDYANITLKTGILIVIESKD